MRTFCEFSSVELTGLELYCYDVAEGFVKELYWDSQSAHDGGLELGFRPGPRFDATTQLLLARL